MAQSAEQIVVTGGWPLNGTVRVPAAKNSVLPLLAAALLCQRPVRLRGVPRLSDVECSLALLRGAGCTAQWQGSDVALSGSPVQSTLPGQTAAQMRASILFCAPLLARLGRAETVLPGGCRIGSRPIDLHLTGLARMGVQELDAGPGRLVLLAPSGLHGAEITLRFPSVGGAGSSTLLIEGRRALGGCVFSPLPDRVFASTLACAAAAAGGRVELTGCSPELYAPVLEILAQMGCRVERGGESVQVARFGRLYGAGRVFTGVYPALATDAAPPLAAAMLCAEGESSIEDVIFERRFACAEGFAALGGRVNTAGRVLHIRPGGALRGTRLSAPDLRGGAALVLAAMAAQGRSQIGGVAYLDRGYADFTEILASLGARIYRETKPA